MSSISRPCLVVLVGLPGAGKSSWLKSIGANAISSDALRLLLADDENDQTINAQVFAALKYLGRERLALGRPVTYIDATNISRRERRTWIELARSCHAEIQAIWFDVPLTICKARNAGRSRKVPEWVLDLMAARFVPPSAEEGFDVVQCLNS